MATLGARRLQKELLAISRSRPDHIWAAALETNIHEVHYVLEGPPGSPYECVAVSSACTSHGVAVLVCIVTVVLVVRACVYV
jgi:hypothetical protein